jgi:hypothetical protein
LLNISLVNNFYAFPQFNRKYGELLADGSYEVSAAVSRHRCSDLLATVYSDNCQFLHPAERQTHPTPRDGAFPQFNRKYGELLADGSYEVSAAVSSTNSGGGHPN